MTLAWIANIFNYGLSVIRDFYFFRNIPPYNIKAVIFKSSLLVITTSQSFAYLIQTFLRQVYDEKMDPNFPVIIWMILGVFSVTVAHKQIELIFLKLVMGTRGSSKKSFLESSNLMIHKIFTIKYFYKEKKLPGHQTQNYSFPYLVSESIDLCSERIEEKMDGNPSSARSLKFLNKYFVGHLENLIEKFPKNNLIKLILAWFYIRKLDLYGPGIRILHGLIHSRDRSAAFNASLLIYELEKRIKNIYKNESSKLDLGEYTKSLTAVINLKSLILKQANLQIKLCSEISQSNQDLHQIFRTAQDIYQTRASVIKEIKKVFNIVPEYYLEPYKICAHYHLNLNFSLEAYEHYEKLYERLAHKNDKILSNTNLTQETLYNKNTNILIFSGAKANMGIINYCSKGYRNFVQHPVIGTHIGTLCPQSLRKFYSSIINNLIEEGNKGFLEKIEPNFYFNYPTLELFPMQFYMNVVPYFTEGLHYAFISLPSSLGHELISFLENGEIEAYTPGIGRSLNLTQATRKGKMVLNVANISKELQRVNEAFNVIRNGNLSKMTAEEAKEICESYLGEGEILKLKPIQFGDMKIFEEEEELNHNVYRCTIIEVTVGPCYFRRLKLEKIENKVFRRGTDQRHATGRFGPDTPSPVAKKGRTLKSQFYSFPSDVSPRNRPMFSEPSEYETGNEKETGWINLEPLVSPSNQTRFETLGIEGLPRLVSETNERWISSGDQVLTSTARNLVPNSPVTIRRHFFMGVEKMTEFMSLSEVLESEVTSDDTKFYKTKGQLKATMETQVTSASSSNTARLAKALNEAINTPYRPISHRVFGGLICVLFLSIIISQIGMKIIMDNETGNLETKKKVLRSAERRNDYLISINRRYRYLDGAIKGWYAPNDISPDAIPRILSYAVPNTTSLAQENARLMIYTRSLEPDDLKKMYITNVKVYQNGYNDPNPVSANFTSFQATEQVVQASLKAITLIEGDYMKSKEYLDFIFLNAVNDLLLVGEITADLFLESMNSQTKVLKTKMTQNFIIVFGVFGVVGVLSLILIYREYCNEVNNLTAFVKINKKGVANVSAKLIRFSKLIEDDVNFEDLKEASSASHLKESTASFATDNENYAKRKRNQAKEDAQVPNSTKIGLKYRLLMAKEIVFLVVLMGLIALMISLVGRYIDILSGSLNQIHFLDRMIYKFDLAASTYFDLLAENGTSYVRNHLTPIEFDNGIATVGIVRNSITEQLQNSDGSYDPVIEGILFDNACHYLNATDAAACVAKQKGAETVSFIQLVSNLEAVLISMRTRYEQSDKSIASLANLILRGQSEVSSSMLTITSIYQTMALRLDATFSKEILHYQYGKAQMVIIIAIFTALVCSLKYFVIVKDLQRNVYQFRNALKLFPPRLILSNFMLKTFLIKTTQGSFNWFKTDF